MTRFDESQHPRGHHTHPGRFSEKSHTAPEATLPPAAPSDEFAHAGGQLRVTRIDEMSCLVEGVGEEYQQQFFAPNTWTAGFVRRTARQVYEQTVIAALSTRTAEGDTSPELAELLNRTSARVYNDNRAWEGIRDGDSDYFSREDLTDDMLDELEVIRGDDGMLRAEGRVLIDFHNAVPDGILDSDDWLNAHSDRINTWVREMYGADSSGGEDWGYVPVVFAVEDTDASLDGDRFPATPDGIAAHLAEKTKLVELHNDLNGGYHGRKLYGFFGSLTAALNT